MVGSDPQIVKTEKITKVAVTIIAVRDLRGE
jgi:hypothetical protein